MFHGIKKNVRVLETSSTRRFFKVLTTTQSGSLAQSVASLTANPRVAILIPARSNTFVEIDHEIISTVILGHEQSPYAFCLEGHVKAWKKFGGHV